MSGQGVGPITPRSCPNCGIEERRWVEHGRPMVNLNPLTGQCVDCLAALAREMGPPAETQDSLFDPRAAAANDRGDA